MEFGKFDEIVHLLVAHDRLRMAALDQDLVWVLPSNVLPGVTTAYGIPVLRAEIPEPLLAHTGRGAQSDRSS